MPPYVSDNDASEASDTDQSAIEATVPVSEPKKATNGKKRKVADVTINGKGETPDPEEDGGDDEEDVYDVEKIMEHKVTKKGAISLKIKWLGYDNPSDMTWEPEDNIAESSKEILAEYYNSIGGRPAPPVSATGRKRASKGQTEEAPAKRHKKDEVKEGWRPTGRSWDSDVEEVTGLTQLEDGSLSVNVKWVKGKGFGTMTKNIAYERFPKKMLAYYESKLTFTSGEAQD